MAAPKGIRTFVIFLSGGQKVLLGLLIFDIFLVLFSKLRLSSVVFAYNVLTI